MNDMCQTVKTRAFNLDYELENVDRVCLFAHYRRQKTKNYYKLFI